jgi:estrogen-related receptor beta like 1
VTGQRLSFGALVPWQVQQRYNDTTEEVADFTAELGSVSEKLEYTKSTMDEQENNRLDTKPLHDIKRAKEKLRAELKQMEVKIGVAEHTLLKTQLKARNQPQSTHQRDYDSDDD